jgi:hypothetical protein
MSLDDKDSEDKEGLNFIKINRLHCYSKMELFHDNFQDKQLKNYCLDIIQIIKMLIPQIQVLKVSLTLVQ